MNENISDKVFTEVDNKVNASLNNLEVNCITNPDNKFSLDSDGNLHVKSLTTDINASSIDFNSIYPIGAIYLSVDSTNPSSLFGGTWEQIKDRFLLACGDTYLNGTTGGEATHALTTAEMPSHTHTFSGSSHAHSFSATTSSAGAHTHTIGADHDAQYQYKGGDWSLHSNSPDGAGDIFYTGSNGAHTHTISGATGGNTQGGTNSNTGGSGSHNNMPPYLAVYMWKRVG